MIKQTVLRNTFVIISLPHFPTIYVVPRLTKRQMRCDVVCQSITLKNIPTGQVISLLLTHIVWLFT